MVKCLVIFQSKNQLQILPWVMQCVIKKKFHLLMLPRIAIVEHNFIKKIKNLRRHRKKEVESDRIANRDQQPPKYFYDQYGE